jgi:uncharacterized membrane protein
VTPLNSSRLGVWLSVTYFLATVAWSGAVAASPYLLTHSSPGTPGFRAAALVYTGARVVCHQQSARSFHAWNAQLPVCARCTGLYMAAPAGALAGLIAIVRRRRREAAPERSRRWRVPLLLSAAPIVVTVAQEWGRLAPVSAALRAASALPVGFVVSWLITDTIGRVGHRAAAGAGTACASGRQGRHLR